MRLIDQNPKYTSKGVLVLDCPGCKTHRVKLDNRWSKKGFYDDLTVYPATIISKCCKKFFSIVKGNVEPLQRQFSDSNFITG